MIRRATADDIDDREWREQIAAIAEEFFNEAKLPGTLKKGLFFQCWKNCLSSGVGLLLCSYRDTSVTGAIGGIIVPSPITGDILLSEAFWFVKKEFRGVTGMKLLMQFLNESKDLGVDHVTMAHLHFALSEKAEAVYEKIGFRKLETHYLLTP